MRLRAAPYGQRGCELAPRWGYRLPGLLFAVVTAESFRVYLGSSLRGVVPFPHPLFLLHVEQGAFVSGGLPGFGGHVLQSLKPVPCLPLSLHRRWVCVVISGVLVPSEGQGKVRMPHGNPWSLPFCCL